jgi:hypothetical protein
MEITPMIITEMIDKVFRSTTYNEIAYEVDASYYVHFYYNP